jgi:hypothetical protein
LFIDPLDREPSAHVFYESHVPWLQVNDALPKKVSQSSLESSQQDNQSGTSSSDA